MTLLAKVTALTDALVDYQMGRPVAAWHWGPALQGFAYDRLQTALGDDRYVDYLLRYARHHTSPVINSSDTAAPGLITYALEQRGYREFHPITQRVLGYIANAPRAVDHAVNHLGDGGWAKLYPRSVWVDTLMMFGVFPALAAEGELRDRAAQLPGLCASLLQDSSGLWRHAYWAPSWHSRRGRPYPRRVHWARGNAWVIAALPMILEALGDHEETEAILRIFTSTADALLPLQRDDGGFTTLLTGRQRGRPETSATALMAAGWYAGIRHGWLEEARFLPAAQRAAAYVATRITAEAPSPGIIGRWLSTTAAASTVADYRGPVLRGVSGPTIPMPVLPRLGYTRLAPEAINASYGVAAAAFAAVEESHF